MNFNTTVKRIAKFGIIPFKILDLNPSNEEYLAITGEEPRFDLTYPIVDGEIPMLVLAHNSQVGYQLIRFPSVYNIKNYSETSGNTQYINAHAETVWCKDLNDLNTDKWSWYKQVEMKPCVKGEETFMKLIKLVANHSSRWEQTLTSKLLPEASFDQILEGNFSGFKKFFEVFRNSPKNGTVYLPAYSVMNDKGYVNIRFNVNANTLLSPYDIKVIDGEKSRTKDNLKFAFDREIFTKSNIYWGINVGLEEKDVTSDYEAMKDGVEVTPLPTLMTPSPILPIPQELTSMQMVEALEADDLPF